MSEPTKATVKRWMLTTLELDPSVVVDEGNEVNMTKLAELAAHSFGHDEWLNELTENHWLWDAAFEVFEWHEKHKE